MADREVTTKYILQGDPSGMVAAADRARNSMTGLVGAVSRAEQSISALSATGKTSVDRLQNAFDSLKIKSNFNIEAERSRIVAAFDQISRSGVASASEISRAQAAMKLRLAELDGGVAQVAGRFDLFSGVASRFSGVLAGIGIAAMVSQLHAAGTASERFRNSFEASTGSVHKGAAEYAYARAEALRLGLDLQSTADSYMKLTANAKGTILEGEKTRQIFSAVTGAARALGLQGESTSGVLRAIGQMMSKGTVQSEELKSQVGEHLPQAFQIAARAMGVSTSELSKMLEKGEVISDDFLPRFAAELQKTFPPGEKAMVGLSAETERLKTAWFELKQTVMDNGGVGMFASAARGMTWLADETERFYRTVVKLDNSRKTKTGPLTASDKALAAPEFSEYFGGMTNSLYTPANPYAGTLRMGPERTVDFGATLTRDNPMTTKEAASFGKASRHLAARAVASKDLTNEFRKLVQEQEKDFLKLSDEIAATADAESLAFGLMTMGGGDLTTSRYNVTNPSQYRLMDGQSRSIPQSAPEAPSNRDMRALDRFAGLRSELGGGNDPYSQQKQYLQRYYDERFDIIVAAAEAEGEISAKHNEASLKLYEGYTGAMAEMDRQRVETAVGYMGQQMTQLGQTLMQGSKDQFEVGKGLAIAGAVIDTYRAATGAYAAMASIPYVGPFLGAAAAAAAVVSGMAQVATIESTRFEPRETGGPVQAGRHYLVGERGPELLTMGANSSGFITPNKSLQSRPTNVTVVYQISPGLADTVRSEIMKAVPAITNHTVSAVGRAINSGGSLSAAVGRM